MIDSPIEPIVGYAKGISGTIDFDPVHLELSHGFILVDVSSVQFANEGYTRTAQGYALNGQTYPQLKLVVKSVFNARKIGTNTYRATVLADFICRGISQPKRLDVFASYFPGRAEERTGGNFKGDLLVLRTHFDVSRSAHGISNGIPSEMVDDKIRVDVAVVGTHYAVDPKKGVVRK